ncbi:hypothetical protein [Prochlorococcus sp. MIT 1306]|uniref:hypothetical protein n=1 Tax=Prochlorococcus sp. MIT 1306 TaxID=1799667 RepID=UPI0007B37586|nr:hypothetical protein [Prochlorococcus sp. MIT 1306]KZR64008.1 hypothetical protein PMIT1306_00978 [Prochlorococcus sp. MIT 1306]
MTTNKFELEIEKIITLTIAIGFVTTVATSAFTEVNAQLNTNSNAAGPPFERLQNEVKAKN